MQFKRYIFLALLLICSYSSIAQWTEISNIEEQHIETLNFLDDNLGYVLMNDESGNTPAIMKTIDGGENWTALKLPTRVGEFQDICFFKDGQGVVMIRDLNNEIVPTRVFRTLDNGESWEDISPAETMKGVGVGQCHFLDQNTGFFATNKTLYTTKDGGENWTEKEFNEYIISMDFLDAEHGLLGTWDGTFSYKGGILATSDGGLTWNNYLLNDNYTSIGEVRQINRELAFASPVHSWASIQAREFYKSTDGGESWNSIEIPMPVDGYTLRQIDFKDEMNGVICVGNSISTYIFNTSNGGQNWIEEGVISSTYNSDLQLTPNSGYIGGKSGSFYKRSESSSVKEEKTQIRIKLYPSPVKSGQKVNWNSTDNFTKFVIIDQMGNAIHQQSITQKQASIPQLTPGIYFVLLSNEKLTTTSKLIVD